MTATLIILAAYLLGAVPFGLVMGHAFGLGDIRKIGSGNIGATNVLRTGNKVAAALTLLLDTGKGAIAALGAGLIDPALAAPAGAVAFVGHCFPIYLKFQGGKGIATFGGTLFAVAWPVGLAAMATWAATALIFRISSLAGIVSAIAVPLYAYAFADARLAVITFFMSAAVLWRHDANIRRLLKGEEPKIGQK